MTTIGHRVDNKMRRRCNDNKTMGTAQPAGQIRHRRHRVVGPIGVGNEGHQGGASGGRVGGELCVLIIVKLGSPVFFWQHDVIACTVNKSSKNYGTPTM